MNSQQVKHQLNSWLEIVLVLFMGLMIQTMKDFQIHHQVLIDIVSCLTFQKATQRDQIQFMIGEFNLEN